MLFDINIIKKIKEITKDLLEFNDSHICDYDGVECDIIIVDNTIIINKAKINGNITEEEISNILSDELETYVNVIFENIDIYNSNMYAKIIIDIEE